VCLFLSSDLANYTFSLTSLGRRQRLCYIVGIYGVEEQRTDPDNRRRYYDLVDNDPGTKVVNISCCAK
jgi:hypothetical protein